MNDYSKTKKSFKTVKRIIRVTGKLLATVLAILVIVFVAQTIGILSMIHVEQENPKFTNGKLEVLMLDVGQGDSTLLLQNNHAMLVDTGTLMDCHTVSNYLQELGVKRLDYLVVTHPHQDHAGGLYSVLGSVKVDTLIVSDCPSDGWGSREMAFIRFNNFVQGYYNFLYGGGLIKHYSEYDSPISFADSTFEFYQAQRDDYTYLNDYSIVMKVEYGDYDFMLTGDIQEDRENELLESNFDISSDVYFAAHHGSRTSNSYEFMQRVNPQYVLISSDNGNNNLYGHPVKRFMDYLEENCIPVYRTDESGTVVITTDGTSIRFDTKPDDYLSGKELYQSQR